MCASVEFTMNNTTFIPNNLRERRKAAGLLQKDAAQALGLDCADRISHWENGTAMPSVVNLFKLAAVYGVAPHELYPELYAVTSRPNEVEGLALAKI